MICFIVSKNLHVAEVTAIVIISNNKIYYQVNPWELFPGNFFKGEIKMKWLDINQHSPHSYRIGNRFINAEIYVKMQVEDLRKEIKNFITTGLGFCCYVNTIRSIVVITISTQNLDTFYETNNWQVVTDNDIQYTITHWCILPHPQ